MSYVSNEILNGYKRVIEVMDETIDIKDETIELKNSIIKQYSEQVIILTGRNNDLTEQVAYWTNLYHELKNTEGETK